MAQEWMIEYRSERGTEGVIYSEWWDLSDGNTVVMCNSEADAKWLLMVITSNPGLYEALEELRTELYSHAEGNWFLPMLEKADAALARARGEA